MSSNFNPAQLRCVGEQSGMSQSARQKSLGIWQTHLSKLETDGVFPTDAMLLSNLTRQFVSETPQALEELHLSPERFRERYPDILLEGQSVMTPTVS